MSIKQKLHHLNFIEIIHKQSQWVFYFFAYFHPTCCHSCWLLLYIDTFPWLRYMVKWRMLLFLLCLMSKNKLSWCFLFNIFHHTSSIRDTIADNIFSYRQVVHIFHFLRMIMHWDFIMSSCCILKPCWTLLDMIFTQKVSWRNST